MLILGIDPGLNRTGFGLIEINKNKPHYIESGVIVTNLKQEINQRLVTIFKGISMILNKYNPAEICIEKVFANTNAKTTLLLGHARGAIICAIGLQLKTIYEYTALQIKKSVVGYGHATKQQIQFMVKDRLHLSAKPNFDAADALACALTHMQYKQYEKIIQINNKK